MDLQFALKWFELQGIDGVDLLSLKKKYRKLTLKYHPDKGGKTKDFVQLQSAYSFLQEYIKYPNSHESGFNSNQKQSTNNTSDIEFYKNQVEELQKSNLRYQNLIDSQITSINNFYKNLDKTNANSREYSTNLSNFLDDELAKLDKRHKAGWWKSVIGMKTMSKNDLVYYQNQLINEHNELLAKSQKDNIELNHRASREALEQIVRGLNEF
jgi:ribosome-binding ATPase YchF (GTP1/OBG family)